MQKYTHDRLSDDARPFHKQSRTRSLRFLLPRLALVLLIATITVTIAIQSAYACGNGNKQQKNQQGGGNNKQGGGGNPVAATIKASGKATTQLQGTKATLNSFSLSGGPSDVGLIIHIHAKNTESTLPADKCKGPVLFVIENPQGGDPGY